jgi:hypothetical protein
MSGRLDYCAVCWKMLPTYQPGGSGSLLVIRHHRPGKDGAICEGSDQQPTILERRP